MKQPWVYMCSPSWSPLPPTSPPDPSRSSPVHQARALVSCIQPGLVICFNLDNTHVSMLFSWNIPPSPSPTESKRLFYTSVSLNPICFAYRVIITFLTPHPVKGTWDQNQSVLLPTEELNPLSRIYPPHPKHYSLKRGEDKERRMGQNWSREVSFSFPAFFFLECI